MAQSFFSRPNFTFDIPEAQMVDAQFNYQYYCEDELVRETKHSEDEEKIRLFGHPRYVSISLRDTINDLSFDDDFAQSIVENQNFLDAIFTPDNLNKLHSEVDINSRNYLGMTFTHEEAQKEIEKRVQAKIQSYRQTQQGVSNVQAIMKFASQTSSNVDVAALTNGKNTSGLTEINLQTGQLFRTVETVNSPFTYNVNLNADVIKNVVNNSSESPFNIFYQKWSQMNAAAEEIAKQTKFRFKEEEIDLTDFQLNVALLKEVDSSGVPIQISPAFYSGLAIIGYVIFKTEISRSGVRTPKPAILIINRDMNSHIDYDVKYGVEYEYTAHTIAYCRLWDGNNKNNFLIASRSGSTIKVNCIERNPPTYPQNVTFNWDYDNDQVLIEWDAAYNKQFDDAGFLVFRRPSLISPYSLCHNSHSLIQSLFPQYSKM